LIALAKSHHAAIRASAREILTTMDPIGFEHLVRRLLEAMDYQNVTVTARSNDKGVDVVADIELGITSVREVVQAKRHAQAVQRKELDALRGSLHRFRAVRGTLITTGTFSKGTRDAAFESGAAPITLIDGEKLIDLLIEYEVGIRKKTIDILELDSAAFAASELEARRAQPASD
jgi:restriction system protein